jgi:hypothetical protein
MDGTPGCYRHFKGGLYDVIGVATDAETGEDAVIYRGTLDDIGALWSRPLAMFQEAVEVEGRTVPRFTREGA